MPDTLIYVVYKRQYFIRLHSSSIYYWLSMFNQRRMTTDYTIALRWNRKNNPGCLSAIIYIHQWKALELYSIKKHLYSLLQEKKHLTLYKQLSSLWKIYRWFFHTYTFYVLNCLQLASSCYVLLIQVTDLNKIVVFYYLIDMWLGTNSQTFLSAKYRQ